MKEKKTPFTKIPYKLLIVYHKQKGNASEWSIFCAIFCTTNNGQSGISFRMAFFFCPEHRICRYIDLFLWDMA